MNIAKFLLLSSALLLALPSAAVPDVLTFVGTLKQGSAPANGTFTVVATLFDDATAGSVVFSQTETSLVVVDGELILDLGDDPGNVLGDDALVGGTLFLAITVDGEELSPRVPLTSVPYARRAAVAEEAVSVGGLDANDIANLYTSGAGLTKVGTEFSLANGGVSTQHLAPGAVTSSTLAAGAVTSTALAAGAVTGASILDGSVGGADLANGAVTSAKIATAAVTIAAIADGAVVTSKIADFTIVAADLAPNAVTAAKVQVGAIGASQIATGAVGTTELANNAVTADKVRRLPVLREPAGCGGHLVLGPTVPACITLSCDIHRNTYLTNNEDIAPSYSSCDGATCSFTNPQRCAVSNTPVGFLVAP